MEAIQIIKRVNNTELGKGRTHEKYIQIPRELDIEEVFPRTDKNCIFMDKESGTPVVLRYTVGREKRVVGLSDFYSARRLEAGDTVMLEMQKTPDGDRRFFISCRRNRDSLFLLKVKDGFEILTPGRTDLLGPDTRTGDGMVEVLFQREVRKRQDSPEATRIYDVTVDGQSIAGDYKSKEIVEIKVQEGKARISRVCIWKKYVFRTEVDDE